MAIAHPYYYYYVELFIAGGGGCVFHLRGLSLGSAGISIGRFLVCSELHLALREPIV